MRFSFSIGTSGASFGLSHNQGPPRHNFASPPPPQMHQPAGAPPSNGLSISLNDLSSLGSSNPSLSGAQAARSEDRESATITNTLTPTPIEPMAQLILNSFSNTSDSYSTTDVTIQGSQSIEKDPNKYECRLREELNSRYPTDAEETQRLLKAATPVSTGHCDTIMEDAMLTSSATGCIKGVVQAGMGFIVEKDVFKAANSIAKGCMGGTINGLLKGDLKTENCKIATFHDAAKNKVLKESYITPESREKATSILAETIETVSEKKRKRSPSPTK